jgi:hypothetical protein
MTTEAVPASCATIAGLNSLATSRNVPLATVINAAASRGTAEMRAIIAKPPFRARNTFTLGVKAVMSLKARPCP